MAHTELRPNFVVTLHSDEFRLITLALAGCEFKDRTDLTNARALNEHLCHQRRVQLTQAQEHATRALEQAKKITERDTAAPQPKEAT